LQKRRRRHTTPKEASVLIRRSVACIFFVLALSAVSASASPILSVAPLSQTVSVGDTFTVNIDIADVVDLFAFSFDLAFDPNIVTFQSIVEGTLLQSGGLAFIGSELSPGTISIGNSLIGPVSGVGGGGTLAIVTFFATMAGTTSFSFPVVPDLVFFLDSNLGEIAIGEPTPGSVLVNAAPTSSVPDKPSIMVLVAAGLSLAAFRCVTRASWRESVS